MKVLVTGATGFVGQGLVKFLVENCNSEVNAMVRSAHFAQDILPRKVRLFQGDVQNDDEVRKAMRDCEVVFHLAALTGVWAKDPNLFYSVNVEGTRTVMEAAIELGVKKVIVTSTAGVMGRSPAKDVIVDEKTNKIPTLASLYDRSKLQGEKVAFSFLERGLPVVVVNPTRIYGPGANRESNSVTKLVKQFAEGKWRIIPGQGTSIGNYVFVDDVVRGHYLAMERGIPGERYILGGENASYLELFELLRQITGSHHRLLHTPLRPILFFAKVESSLARTFGRKPLLVPDFVRKLSQDWNMSSEKAIREIGYSITPLREGLSKTYQWLSESRQKN